MILAFCILKPVVSQNKGICRSLDEFRLLFNSFVENVNGMQKIDLMIKETEDGSDRYIIDFTPNLGLILFTEEHKNEVLFLSVGTHSENRSEHFTTTVVASILIADQSLEMKNAIDILKRMIDKLSLREKINTEVSLSKNGIKYNLQRTDATFSFTISRIYL